MSQPELNIGTAGHVDHGKTTLLARLTGKWADEHSEEMRRGITIKLGYADAVISKCEKCKKITVKNKCGCGGKIKPVRKVSFVDAPGHESLMATMLSGAATMDAAILLIAANDGVQEQTKEHLNALEILGVKSIIIVQNKIDLVSKEEAIKNYKEIKEFVKGTIAEKAPIIPISAEHEVNVDKLMEKILEIPKPSRDLKQKPVMIIARSFDINKPGTSVEKISGGVVGGVIIRGEIRINDKLEIKPGIKNDKGMYQSLKTSVQSLWSGREKLEKAGPGGSVGVGIDLDPYTARSDKLSGNVLGLENELPPVHDELTLNTKLLGKASIKMNEPLMITAWTAKTVGIVSESTGKKVKVKLKLPICVDYGERVALAQRKEYKWTLIGYGEIQK